jgi:hypothetical protein
MATLKNIFAQVSMMNPTISTVSSIGSFVSESNQQTADFVTNQIMSYLPHESLAWKIITSTTGRFSEKQLWVIAYELLKNDEYCTDLDKTLAEIEQHEAWRKAKNRERRHRRAERKAAAVATHKIMKIQEETPKNTNTTYQTGDVVEHAKFGEGTVIAGDEKTITVRFNTVGEKHLLLQFAPITKK